MINQKQLNQFYTINRIYIYFFILVFVVLGLESLTNHYLFKTYAYDLGIFNQGLYHYSLFSWDHNTVLQPNYPNVLGDHFNVLVMVISPFRYIFGTYTLLIFQIIFLIFAGIGIIKFLRVLKLKEIQIIWALIHFYSIWIVVAVVGFDYHDNVFAAMFIPWILYFSYSKKLFLLIFTSIFMCLTKEDSALICGLLLLSICFIFDTDKQMKWILALTASFAFLYFVCVIKIVMPSLSPLNNYYHEDDYEVIARFFKSDLHNFFPNLWTLITSFFVKHTEVNGHQFDKMNFYIAFLLSGGWVFIFRPKWLLVILPIIAIKMLNSVAGKWGLEYQYNMPFVPLIVCVLYYEFRNHNSWIVRVGAIGAIVFSILRYEGGSFGWFPKDRYLILSKSHYKNEEFEPNELRAMVKLIPDKVAVCALSNTLPHLAFREKIYIFPWVSDAEYVLTREDYYQSYPNDKEEYLKQIQLLKNSSNWINIYKKNGLILYKKLAK